MARKFFFRLEPLLKIRTHKQLMAKESLMQIVNLRLRKEGEIEEMSNYLKYLNKQKVGSARASDLQSILYHIEFTENQIKNLIKEKEQISEIEAIKRDAFHKTLKEEKILLKLKEKKQTEYKEAVNKEDMLLMDEMALKYFTPKDI